MTPPPTTTTCARAGRTRQSCSTDEAPGGLAGDPAVLVDDPAAHDGAHDTAPHRLPDVGAERMAVEKLACLERPGLTEVDEREVGVAAHLEPMLAGERKPPRGAVRGD